MKLALRSNHHAKKQGFFKIIVSEIGPESKLMIPKEFVKSHEEELRGLVLLKAPGSTAPWPVAVVRTKGEVWLQNGWPEFATFYSLCFGSLLVFEYLEHSDFGVRVFDKNATEIDYPVTCNTNLDGGESVPQVRKREAKIDGSSRRELVRGLRACKKTRASTEDPFNNGPKLKQEKANQDPGSTSKEDPLDLAKAFKSENPFFVFYMRPSYVCRGGVEVSKTFKETYRKWKNKDQVIFQIGTRSWPVGCRSFISRDRCVLSAGWVTFSRDNSLNVDDVCVFELINPSRKLFNVFIFRAKREAA